MQMQTIAIKGPARFKTGLGLCTSVQPPNGGDHRYTVMSIMDTEEQIAPRLVCMPRHFLKYRTLANSMYIRSRSRMASSALPPE